MDCVFCKISNNELNSYTIFEDKIIKVFLSSNPMSNGHILIIPKKHYVTIEDVDLEALNHINVITKKMYKHLNKKIHPDGITILQNNGYQQEIKHYHVHLIPKNKDKQEIIDLEEIYNILK